MEEPGGEIPLRRLWKVQHPRLVRGNGMSLPQIAISYIKTVPQNIIDDFQNAVSRPNLDVEAESRDEDIYASVEWLLPAAVAVFISKAYFDGFLKEMGKDHYHVLKEALKNLKAKIDHSVPITLIATAGKVSKEPVYSRCLSIYAEADNAQRFKLLIQNDTTNDECEEIIDAFLGFLSMYNNSTLSEAMIEKLSTAKPTSGTLLIAYIFETHELVPVSVSMNKTSKGV